MISEAKRIQNAFQKFHTSILLHQFRIPKFKAKVHLDFDVGSLKVETASYPWQVEELLRLRKKVFFPNCKPGTIDIDEFDAVADHLMVKDKTNGQVLGTYRLLFSEFTDSFYSESEFIIDDFLSWSGTKLELGRASVVESARTGPVIQALWMGLANYMKVLNPRYLFGCSSVMSVDPSHIKHVTQKLARYKMPQHCFETTKPFAFPDISLSNFCSQDKPQNDVALEPLLRTYLSAGARVAGGPALDKEFQCVDFLTILDTLDINPLFRRKFLGEI